jgi:hypothetical protein
MPAAIARFRRRLRLAMRTVGWTKNANVEVIVMAGPRPHLTEPIAIQPRLAAQRFLDRGINEDALDIGITRRSTDGRRGREYLTNREVERLIEAAKQNRSGIGTPRRSWSPTAMASGLRSWSHCDGTTSTSPPGACMYAGPRAGMPACIRYRPGKVGHCGSSYAKHQHRPTSSSRNVALLFPQPDISAWWPGRA